MKWRRRMTAACRSNEREVSDTLNQLCSPPVIANLIMLKKLIPCLIGASFALASGLANAKEYAIEIIVFERPNAKSGDEQWDFSSARTVTRLAHMATLAAQSSTHITTDELASLAPVRRNLIESGYRILNTTRWQQPTSFYQDAPLIPLGDAETALVAGFVRIYTTSLIYADLHLQLSPQLSETDLELADAAVADAVAGDTVAGDRATNEQYADEPHAAAQPPNYFIAEKRRLRFAQVHYFDHPLFGAILGVWAIEE